jgi:hypothetical protein
VPSQVPPSASCKKALKVRRPWQLRRFLLALLGVLLPLPLAWLLYAATHGALQARIQEGRVVPILTDEEFRAQLSYLKPCQTDTDCTTPLACYFDPARRMHVCGDSTCQTDLQCEEGYTCRTLSTVGRQARVRLCVLKGVRAEGEQCAPFFPSAQYHCVPGLLCQDWCGRPCQMEELESCPEGFFCREGPEGASCLPRCESQGCAAGQRCVSRDEGIAICATVHGQDCELEPCPEGQKCQMRALPEKPGQLWGQCIQACGEDKPPCLQGRVCIADKCYRACDPHDPSACEPHFVCDTLGDNSPWYCQPG